MLGCFKRIFLVLNIFWVRFRGELYLFRFGGFFGWGREVVGDKGVNFDRGKYYRGWEVGRRRGEEGF